jgi:hypothetical protein
VPATIINCDDFNAATLLSQPWLLLIKAAEQLNDQLPGDRFGSLLRAYQGGPGQHTSLTTVASDIRRVAPIGPQVVDNFCRTALGRGEDTPFVIVLDGLDYVSLESLADPNPLRELLGLFRQVHDKVGNLRVVLSGRDDLRKLIPYPLGAEDVHNYELPRFSVDEAEQYLKRRKVLDPDKIAAIREKSGRIPMVVALYADWLATDINIKAEDILKHSKPQVDFLVSRILKRANSVVRLTLGYAVAAQASPGLGFEFFRDVLLPAWRTLPPDMANALDIGPLPGLAHTPRAEDFHAQRQLWAEVLRLAEQGKWISTTPVGGEKVVKVHADVRSELLAMLREDTTFRYIHELAAEHYQRRARASLPAEWEPEPTLLARDADLSPEWPSLASSSGSGPVQPDAEWPGLCARSLYHRIQRGDPAALDYWRDCVRQARDRSQPDWIREIAEEVTQQSDFLAATAISARRQREQPLPSPEARRSEAVATAALPDRSILLPALYECYVELAHVDAQRAGLLPGWQAAALAPGLPPKPATIESARAIRIGAGDQALIGRDAYEPILLALNAVVAGEFETAIEELGTDQPRPQEAGTALGDYWLVRARAHARYPGHNSPVSAGPGFEHARGFFDEAARAHADDHDAATYVAVDAASWLLTIDRPDLALERFKRVRDEWRLVHPAGTAAELRARALLALGRPASALEVLTPPPDKVTIRAISLAIRAHLALYRPLLAMQEYRDGSRATRAAAGSRFADELPGRRVEHELLGAETARDLLDPAMAEVCFGRAQECMLLLDQADVGYQVRINAARALFELRATGNIQLARAYLKDDFKLKAIGESAWTEYQLARAELADRRGNGARVETILDEVVGELGEDARASLRVRVAITGLAARSITPDERQGHLRQLVSDLGEVAEPARIAMLSGLMDCLPVQVTGPDAERLRDLMAADLAAAATDHAALPDISAAGRDLAWRRIVVSQVLRVTSKAPVVATPRTQDEASQTATTRDAPGIASALDASLLLELALADLDAASTRSGGLAGDQFARWKLLGARPEPRTESGEQGRMAPGARPASPRALFKTYDGYPVLLAAYTEEWASRQPEPHAPEVVTLLRQAAQRLERSSWLRLSAWHSRLYVALAAATPQAGPGSLPGLSLPAINDTWARLGVPQARAADVSRASQASLPSAAREILIEALDRGGQIQVTWPLPTGEGQPGGPAIDVTEHRFDSESIEQSALDWAAGLGTALNPALSRLRRDDDDPLNLHLDLRRPHLVAQPWELALIGDSPLATRNRTQFVFRTATAELTQRHGDLVAEAVREALGRSAQPATQTASGEGDQQWRENIRALRDLPSRPLRVRLLHPMLGGSLESERRFGERRRELERLYRAALSAAPSRHELDVRTLYGRQATALFYSSPEAYGNIPAEARDWADVIHVLTVMEATEQMPVLNLEIAEGPPLTAPQLDLMVQRLTGEKQPPPLVVLDVVAPPSPVEARRQLLMRNRFAQQLLMLGTTGTVIATGLGDPQASTEQWALIAQTLAEARNPATVWREIRQRMDTTGEPPQVDDADREARAIAFGATALFTSVHPNLMVPPGLIPVPEANPDDTISRSSRDSDNRPGGQSRTPSK